MNFFLRNVFLESSTVESVQRVQSLFHFWLKLSYNFYSELLLILDSTYCKKTRIKCFTWQRFPVPRGLPQAGFWINFCFHLGCSKKIVKRCYNSYLSATARLLILINLEKNNQGLTLVIEKNFEGLMNSSVIWLFWVEKPAFLLFFNKMTNY